MHVRSQSHCVSIVDRMLTDLLLAPEAELVVHCSHRPGRAG